MAEVAQIFSSLNFVGIEKQEASMTFQYQVNHLAWSHLFKKKKKEYKITISI